MKFSRLCSSSIVSLICVSLLACSTKGYSGAERPSGDTGTIYFSSIARADLSNVQVDGVPQGNFENGIKVLPGAHKATATYEVNMPCPMFSVGCIEEISRGECSFDINTVAGRNYLLEVKSREMETVVTVSDQSTHSPAGGGSCVMQKKDYRTNKYRDLPRTN